ncbi:MAG: EamA family transporter [Ferruginibacter sp.]
MNTKTKARLGLLATNLFFAINNVYGIKILGASIAGTYIYSQPIFAAIIEILFLHGLIKSYKVFSAILIFTGVYLCNKKTKND